MGIQAQIAIIIIMDYRQQNNANTECFLYILNVFQLIRVFFNHCLADTFLFRQAKE